jgi:hypothetical protein
MDTDNLTIKEAREIARMFVNETNKTNCVEPTGPWVIGEKYLIRTVTMILTGQLLSVGKHELSLGNAAWIADTGRYADNIKSCQFNEVEPYPADRIVIVGRGSLIDAVTIDKLPSTQK